VDYSWRAIKISLFSLPVTETELGALTRRIGFRRLGHRRFACSMPVRAFARRAIAQFLQ